MTQNPLNLAVNTVVGSRNPFIFYYLKKIIHTKEIEALRNRFFLGVSRMYKQSEIKEQIFRAVKEVREKKPLVPSVTNTVTINLVANAQIAVSGSAAMVYLKDEAESMAKLGEAMYVNMGTMLPLYEDTLINLAKVLKDFNKPWVLDPVGIGVGELRHKILLSFKDNPPSIIRGNASEIITLASLWNLRKSASSNAPKGVDTVDSVDSSIEAAKALASFIHGAVAVSGERDLITDGEQAVYSYGGSHFMEKITGAGCSLGGVCAVYASVANPFIAALTASQHYNFAAREAEKVCEGPASFQLEFLDNLYKASAENIAENKFEFVD